jgi:hypothetical protein
MAYNMHYAQGENHIPGISQSDDGLGMTRRGPLSVR